jgi:sodium-dependent phosphate cotransporter
MTAKQPPQPPHVADPPDLSPSESALNVTKGPGLPAALPAQPYNVAQPGVFSRLHLRKITLFVASLFFFILAIQLMKEGAREVSPLIRNRLMVTNPVNSLGLGWLLAYLVLSGSPVAAAALTFFDAGAIDRLGAFTMITGSRLGASFIVLFVGFIYTLRGHERRTSLSTGLLSLTVTWSTYLAGLMIGLQFLTHHTFDFIQLRSGATLNSAVDLVFAPITYRITATLPRWAVFVVGVAVIMVSFSLFDRALPQIRLKRTEFSQAPRLIYRPISMFLLGAAITTVSMSVSVSLSILVPLSARGYIRRENVIPYIMGANITTFIDTLLAAVLLNNPSAVTVVFVEMVSVALVSLFVLLFLFRAYERALVGFVDWVLTSKRHLAVFMFSMFVVPLLLLLL